MYSSLHWLTSKELSCYLTASGHFFKLQISKRKKEGNICRWIPWGELVHFFGCLLPRKLFPRDLGLPTHPRPVYFPALLLGHPPVLVFLIHQWLRSKPNAHASSPTTVSSLFLTEEPHWWDWLASNKGLPLFFKIHISLSSPTFAPKSSCHRVWSLLLGIFQKSTLALCPINLRNNTATGGIFNPPPNHQIISTKSLEALLIGINTPLFLCLSPFLFWLGFEWVALFFIPWKLPQLCFLALGWSALFFDTILLDSAIHFVLVQDLNQPNKDQELSLPGLWVSYRGLK